MIAASNSSLIAACPGSARRPSGGQAGALWPSVIASSSSSSQQPCGFCYGDRRPRLRVRPRRRPGLARLPSLPRYAACRRLIFRRIEPLETPFIRADPPSLPPTGGWAERRADLQPRRAVTRGSIRKSSPLPVSERSGLPCAPCLSGLQDLCASGLPLARLRPPAASPACATNSAPHPTSQSEGKKHSSPSISSASHRSPV